MLMARGGQVLICKSSEITWCLCSRIGLESGYGASKEGTSGTACNSITNYCIDWQETKCSHSTLAGWTSFDQHAAWDSRLAVLKWWDVKTVDMADDDVVGPTSDLRHGCWRLGYLQAIWRLSQDH